METYSFRIRLHDVLDDEAADRLYDAFDEEIAVEDGLKGHFVGFERQAESVWRSRAPAQAAGAS